MVSKPVVLLLLGSVRPGRMCDRVVTYVKGLLLQSGFEVDILDPAVLNLPLLDTPLHFYPDASQAPKILVDANAKIAAADAFVTIASEYNNTISAALTNMLSHFPSASFERKPCAIVSYSMGPYGGLRAAMHLRALLSEMGALSVPSICPVPAVHETLSEDGKTTDTALTEASRRTVKELAWYTAAIRDHRSKEQLSKEQPELTKQQIESATPKVAARGHQSGPCCQS